MKLVVSHAFKDYAIGDQIKDPETVAEILAGELAVYVVKVALTEADTADAVPAKKASK